MKRTIAIVLFENAEELDFVGPWEVFANLRNARPHLCDVFTVSEKGDTLRCAKGLRVIPDHSFDTMPKADIILLPGGHGRKVEVNNPRMIDFIQNHARHGEITTSVCTGAFLLQKAGLLDGKTATTYWMAMDELRGLGIDAPDERYIDHGSVITSAGVSAGIDMALYLVGRLWGIELARDVQKWIQYFPNPPYADTKAGH